MNTFWPSIPWSEITLARTFEVRLHTSSGRTI